MACEGWIDIATGEEKGRKPIQIRADRFRQSGACTPYYAWPAVDTGADFRDKEQHSGSGWLEVDLKRALSVAEEAGLQSYRIEIATDGTISIIVGGSPEAGDDAAQE